MLMVATRWAGSIGSRPTEEWMNELRAKGRRLLAETDDARASARFLAADAFYPFWLQMFREVGDDVVTESRLSAEHAIEIATELDDPELMSTALDALGGLATSRNDWQGALETARKRLAFEDRLGLYERLDAHTMVAWMSVLKGDLATAASDSADMVARLLPGQAPYPALHLFAWRTLTLTLLGRWDEAVATFWRSLEAWNDAGRHAAGYAMRGFIAGLDLGRARGDARLVGAAIETISSLLPRFPPEHVHQLLNSYLKGLSGLTDRDPSLVGAYPTEVAERRLSLACDNREPLSEGLLAAQLERAQVRREPLLEAQARRAIGLYRRDVAAFGAAIEIWERVGALPLLGRARAERGLVADDQAEVEAGLAILKKVGDVGYLDHFSVSVKGSPL